MVYVGRLFNAMPWTKGAWRWAEACHMLADTDDELHELAARIGLKRSWFQSKSVPHYDLTEGMRAKAIVAGAEEIDRREEGRVIRAWRLKQKGDKQCHM